eukprot:5929962-Amphidinium_carterae.2
MAWQQRSDVNQPIPRLQSMMRAQGVKPGQWGQKQKQQQPAGVASNTRSPTAAPSTTWLPHDLSSVLTMACLRC